MEAAGLTYTADREITEDISDGIRVKLRVIRPSDKDVLAMGLTQLSPRSQYLRFGGVRSGFSAADLKYLTEVDGISHFALLAFVMDGAPEHLGGVGRFIRRGDAPEVAELAIVVIDAFQAHGVGRRMLMHLHKAAHERGIRFFECEYLGDNEAVAHLIHGAHPDAKITAVGSGQMLATFPVVAC